MNAWPSRSSQRAGLDWLVVGFRFPTVFIDRYYDEPDDVEPPWPRWQRWSGDPIWGGHCEYKDHSEEAEFDTVDEAIAWGRARAERVFVRLGSSISTFYAAGTEQTEIEGKPLPAWPPENWPDYLGPGAEKRRWPDL
jgi:hypothetical protein